MEFDLSTSANVEFNFSTPAGISDNFEVGEVSGIDEVKVDGTPLPVINKSVNIDLATPLSKKADKSQVPTRTSQLRNDSGYITQAAIPSKTSQLTNDSGYITKNVNDLTYYTKTSDLPSVPTKTSQLQNDSGYITKDVDNLTYYTKTSDLPAPITVDTALNASSTNPVQNQALYPAIVPTEIYKTAYTYDWSEPAGPGPYNSIAILTLPPGTFTDNSLIELVFHDQFDSFAKHGFMLYGSETSSQRVWLNSIGKPTASVNFLFRIWKWGN